MELKQKRFLLGTSIILLGFLIITLNYGADIGIITIAMSVSYLLGRASK